MGKNNKNITKILMILSCLVMIVSLANINLFKKEEASGSFYEQSSDEYTCQIVPGETVIKQNFKPRYNGLTTLSVRIENEKINQMTGDLLFQIQKDDEVLWEKLIDENEITNWRYVDLDVSEIDLDRELYTLSISCPKNEKTFPYRIYLAETSPKEEQQLFCNNDKETGKLDIVYTYIHVDIIKIIILCMNTICLFTVTICKVNNEKSKYLICVAYIMNAVVIVGIYQILYNSFEIMKLKYILLNVLIVVSIYYIILYLTKDTVRALIIEDIFLYISAIINHYVLQFRGTVILPADIYSIQTAGNVAENYQLSLDSTILFTASFLITCIGIELCMIGKFREMKRKKSALLMGVCISACMLISINPTLQKELEIQVDQSAQTTRSSEIGFLLNFAENISYTIYKKPSGYSEQKVNDILSSVQTEDSKPILEQPDRIIVVMNESFTDLSYLKDIKTNKPYLENFKRIEEDSNSKSGKCVTPVFGGGTSCTEFEFLTGCSMLFLGSGNAPYQQYIQDDTLSIASYLKETGFSTIALHPANPQSWNRHIAYPLLGFDRFISSQSEEFANPTTCRYWADDQALFNEMYNQSNLDDEKIFEFGLTIQCHGGYTYAGDDFESTVQIENYEDEDGSVAQYLTLVSLSDEALGNMIDEYSQSDENVLFLMFGDHLPGLPSTFYNELLGKDGTDYPWCTELYETPYLFWANYDVDFEDVPDVISANFLSVYLLKFAGMELTPYYQFLYDLSKQYPVVSKSAIIDSDGKQYEYDKKSSCYDDLHKYELIQYSILQ